MGKNKRKRKKGTAEPTKQRIYTCKLPTITLSKLDVYNNYYNTELPLPHSENRKRE